MIDESDVERNQMMDRCQKAEREAEEWKKRWTIESMLRENLQLQLDQLKKVPR